MPPCRNHTVHWGLALRCSPRRRGPQALFPRPLGRLLCRGISPSASRRGEKILCIFRKYMTTREYSGTKHGIRWTRYRGIHRGINSRRKTSTVAEKKWQRGFAVRWTGKRRTLRGSFALERHNSYLSCGRSRDALPRQHGGASGRDRSPASVPGPRPEVGGRGDAALVPWQFHRRTTGPWH